jgi:hypothetical protein
MTNPMFIDNTKEWDKCSKTGRFLNKHNLNKQDNLKCINSEAIKVRNVLNAIELAGEVKDKYRKTTDKTMTVITAIYSRLLSEPNRLLKINSKVTVNDIDLIEAQGLKKVLDKMEKLDHITIYSGYPFTDPKTGKHRAIPMCIELKYGLEKRWINQV